MTEAAECPNLKVPDTDIEVKPDGYPTLTGQFLATYSMLISVFFTQIFISDLIDGKTKKNWAKCPHGSGACWFCFAYGKQLHEPKYLDR